MPANKMPEMPEPKAYAAIGPLTGRIVAAASSKSLLTEWDDCQFDGLYTADQMRAMYLAGIADARACVPDSFPPDLNCDMDYTNGASDALNHVRANLTALEQEAKK